MTTYLGLPVLDVFPSRELDASETMDNYAVVVESKAGRFSPLYESTAHPWTRTFNWFCETRADLKNAQDFLDLLKGSYNAFWVPTWVSDFQMTADADAGDDAITVANTQKTLRRPNIALITPTGMEFAAVDSYSGTALNLSAGIASDKIARTTLISYLQVVHLAVDEIEIDFINMVSAHLALPYTELVNEL